MCNLFLKGRSFLLSSSFLFFPIKIFASVIVSGPINLCDGIGRHAIEYHNFFLKNSIDSCLLNSEEKDLGTFMRRCKFLKKFKKNPEIFFHTGCLGYKDEKLFKKFKTLNSCMISLTMFESTKAPDNYVDILNKYFDVAIIPDPYLEKVYIDSGVEIPIFVIPLMFDLSAFLSSKLKTQKNKPFVFGCLSSITPRKNQLLLVETFLDLYGNNKDFKLIINGRYCEPDYLNKINVFIAENKIENVEVSCKALNDVEYLNEFKKLDCYVSLSMGEGFSIQPREAMALGIPCIVANNTAQTTICESGLVMPVSSNQLVDCVYKMPLEFGNMGYQFCTTKNNAKKAFQELVANYDSYLSLSVRARDWAKQYALTESRNEDILTLFNPKKVILSEESKIENGILYLKNPITVKKYNR